MTGREQHCLGKEPETYCGHWAIFLPSIVVAFLYGGAWIVLLATGKGGTALAKLALLVLLMLVPLLAAIACLRFRSLRIEIGNETAAFRQGWLRPRWTRMRLEDIAGVKAQWSPLGRRIGNGALQLSMDDGTIHRVLDVASPDIVAQRIEKQARNLRGGGHQL